MTTGKIPALFRSRFASDPIEAIVWILEWVPLDAGQRDDGIPWSEAIRDTRSHGAIVVGDDGRPFVARLYELEIIAWTDDESALRQFKPPTYSGDTTKVTTLRRR